MLGVHRNLKQKEFFRSSEGFLRAALTGHGHPGPLWKIAKMALFNPCMEFEKNLGQKSSSDVLWKCHWVIFFPKVSQALSKCFSKWINWIISRIPPWIWKILFVLSSYEFLAMLEGKIWKCLFSRVQCDEITVCTHTLTGFFSENFMSTKLNEQLIYTDLQNVRKKYLLHTVAFRS